MRVLTVGVDARKSLTSRRIRETFRWRGRAEGIASIAARAEAVRLAKRVIDLNEDLDQSNAADRISFTQTRPLHYWMRPASVCHRRGGIHRLVACRRVRYEPAFTALADVTPDPRIVGNTIRDRIDRGDDSGSIVPLTWLSSPGLPTTQAP